MESLKLVETDGCCLSVMQRWLLVQFTVTRSRCIGRDEHRCRMYLVMTSTCRVSTLKDVGNLSREVMEFQQTTRGCETLKELMKMPSTSSQAKVTVILNHFQRKTLCAQLDALLHQTLPFHNVWVLAFGSPQGDSLRSIVEIYNDTRIFFAGSSYDFKYYGRFQLALQVPF